MGVSMLKLNSAKAKWRIKLQHAFEGEGTTLFFACYRHCMSITLSGTSRGARTGKWALFLLPFITVLREGLEAIVFVGGVSLGQSASSIPIAAIVGIVCGLI